MSNTKGKNRTEDEMIQARRNVTAADLNSLIPDPSAPKAIAPVKRKAGRPPYKHLQAKQAEAATGPKLAPDNLQEKLQLFYDEKLFREALQAAIGSRKPLTGRDLHSCLDLADEYVRIISAKFPQ